MTARQLKSARLAKGWTQQQAAARLGVSQPYLALLERGRRRVTPRLAACAVRAFEVDPQLLPVPPLWEPSKASPHRLAQQLGALGFPGFAHLGRRHALRHPAAVLLDALAQPRLEARAWEALPWLLLTYPKMGHEWLVANAKLNNLQNRLGFMTALARAVLRRRGDTARETYAALRPLEGMLRMSLLAREDPLDSALSTRELGWLRTNRSELAADWNVLSDLRPEHLPYGA